MSHRPDISDIVRLAQQLQTDEGTDLQTLHRRDFKLGSACEAQGPVPRLLYWLDQLQTPLDTPLHERVLGLGLGLLLFLVGLLGMSGFLFLHPERLVNVPWFFLLFVLLPLLGSVLSLIALPAILLGVRPGWLNLNPGSWLLRRSGARLTQLHALGEVSQLLILRLGQIMGLAFALGAVTAYLLVLAFNDFSFGWSSTFQVGDAAVASAVQLVESPWAGWLPAASVGPDTVTATRYLPGSAMFSPAQQETSRNWWPFLLAAMLCYSLLPRLLLLLLSGRLYRRQLTTVLLDYPGAAQVLDRMNRAPLSTRAASTPEGRQRELRGVLSGDVIVIDWAGALSPGEGEHFSELPPTVQPLRAGFSFEEDQAVLADCRQRPQQALYLVAKAWEPPLSDLADFLEEAAAGRACTVLLRPLRERSVTPQQLDDWSSFCRQLSGSVQLAELHPVTDPAEESIP